VTVLEVNPIQVKVEAMVAYVDSLRPSPSIPGLQTAFTSIKWAHCADRRLAERKAILFSANGNPQTGGSA
jgi:hypothetical protein